MKIIISPAKKMNTKPDELEFYNLPRHMDRTDMLLDELRNMSLEALQALWKCNDKLAQLNYERIQHMNLRENLTPAILSYEGIQYQYMAPAVFEHAMLEYIQEHLRILSGFYGVLKPMDGVVPYRLEMQAKLQVDCYQHLYEFWGEQLYRDVSETQVIVNLASKEYSVCIEKYLKPEDIYITCVFGEIVNGKVVQKGTYAKMARGEMVRFMAEHQIENVEEIKSFTGLEYTYREDLSTDNTYVFIR